MSQNFGRRIVQAYDAPAGRHASRAGPHEGQAGLIPMPRKSGLAFPSKADSRAQWQFWGLGFLVLLGGPMAAFLPDGIGRVLGSAATTIGVVGILLRGSHGSDPFDLRRRGRGYDTSGEGAGDGGSGWGNGQNLGTIDCGSSGDNQ